MENISIIGMGYVGTAMATLIASIKKKINLNTLLEELNKIIKKE